MSLELYNELGFKLIPCLVDKSPDVPAKESWKDPKWHLNIERAQSLQSTGSMIGAWIPNDIIVVDLDRHEGKPDGVESFKKLKEKYNIFIDFMSDTTLIKTAGNGYHLLFYVGENHGIKQGEIKIDGEKTGIDIKTNSGYVITSGSPGYEMLCEYEPMELPERLRDFFIENRGKAAPKKEDNTGSESNKKLLPAKMLKSIINKIPVENFRSNDRWMEFIMSAIATSGTSPEVIGVLEDWSFSDSEYASDRSISNRISSFTRDGGISIGSFIMYMREENVSQHLISNVIKLDSITMTLIEGEKVETDLPFIEPDYHKLAESKYIKELFVTCGNSAAKNILYEAFDHNVIHVKGEKETFYFDGSRWQVLTDLYSVVYTIIFRVSKIHYAKAEENAETQTQMMKIINAINDTTWKSKTITEINAKIREDAVSWDSTSIKETVTTKDGVIDFTKGKIEQRTGYRSEFRFKYIDYTCEEILCSKDPLHYKTFMKSTFPDPETLTMAHQLVSLCITGNTEKRIFQLWEGEGSNGKSTLIDIIKFILKGKTNTYPPLMLMPDKFNRGLSVTPELAAFQGSYAAVGIEVEQTSEFSMGIIKNLTGGDTITANPKHKAQIEFDPTWQLILAVNDLPKFNSIDGAFVGRLNILPFTMSFPRDEKEKSDFLRKGIKPENIGEKIDKNLLLENIYSQKAGIIRFMIETYVELENIGGFIKQSELSMNKKMYYVRDNDDYGKFIEDNCVIEESAFCSSDELTEAFKDYMGLKKASSKLVVMNIKKHNRQIDSDSKEITVKGEFGQDERKRRRGLKGIRLKTQTEIVSGKIDKVPF